MTARHRALRRQARARVWRGERKVCEVVIVISTTSANARERFVRRRRERNRAFETNGDPVTHVVDHDSGQVRGSRAIAERKSFIFSDQNNLPARLAEGEKGLG